MQIEKSEKHGQLIVQVYCLPYSSYVFIFTKKSLNPRISRPLKSGFCLMQPHYKLRTLYITKDI